MNYYCVHSKGKFYQPTEYEASVSTAAFAVCFALMRK